MASFIGDYYVALANARLMDDPPPRKESGSSYFYKDTCFLNPTVYCDDLVPGHREVVGSWYLTPERLGAETLWVTVASAILLATCCPFLLCPRDIKRGERKIVTPAWLKVTSVVCLSIQAYYKLCPSAYPNKVYFLLMPCNVTWIIHVLMSLFRLTGPIKHSLIQFLFSFQVLVWVVFFSADTDDLKGPWEVEFFWLNHCLLLIPPFYYALSGDVKLLTSHGFLSEITNFSLWLVFSSAIMSIIYFTIATPLSFVSLLNINYMTSPPPGFESFGQDYRLYCQAFIAVGFTVARIVTILISLLKKVKRE